MELNAGSAAHCGAFMFSYVDPPIRPRLIHLGARTLQSLRKMRGRHVGELLTENVRPLVTGAGVGLATSVIGTYILSFSADETEQKTLDEPKSYQADAATVRVIDNFSSLNLLDVISRAQRRLLFFTVSGRNIWSSPQMVNEFRNLIFNNRRIQVKFLGLNQYADNDFPTQRRQMMDTPGRYNPYDSDFIRARESARQITDTDPAHNVIDIRFYELLPTTFFIISDERLYISFLLSKPVAECPVIEVDGTCHRKVFQDFLNHFNFYWEESRSFVCVVGSGPDGKFLMVRNRKRGWEWPAGYLEPNESPEQSAEREFLEETGYTISSLRVLRQTPSGIFFHGQVGELVGTPSAREVGDVKFFATLPPRGELSFEDERPLFEEVLRSCR